MFLDEQRMRGKYLQPDHWMAPTFPKGQEQTAVLGVRYTDAIAFCNWLSERETGVWRYRLPTEDDLIKGQNNTLFLAIEAGEGYWTKEGKVRIQKEPFSLDSVVKYVKETLQGDRSAATGIEEGRNVDYDFEEETAHKLKLDFSSVVWSAAEFPYSWPSHDPFVINPAIDLNLKSALGLALHPLALDLALTYSLALDLSRDIARATLDLDPYISSDLHRRMPNPSELAQDLDRLLDYILNREYTSSLVMEDGQQKEKGALCWLAHLYCYTLASYCILARDNVNRSLSSLSKNQELSLRGIIEQADDANRSLSSFLSKNQELSLSSILERVSERYLAIAVIFVLFGGRIGGMFPAWEGILLVREPKKDIEQREQKKSTEQREQKKSTEQRYYSCFISYSSIDEILAQRLYADLQANGVRCWFAPDDMKIGNKIRQHIDEAIHQQDKLLLLLSEHSIASIWVESVILPLGQTLKRISEPLIDYSVT